MKRIYKRIISVALAFLIMLSILPQKLGTVNANGKSIEFTRYDYGDKDKEDYGHIFVPNVDGPLPVVILMHGWWNNGGHRYFNVDSYETEILKWLNHKNNYISPFILIIPRYDYGLNGNNMYVEPYMKNHFADLVTRIDDGTFEKQFGIEFDKSNGYSIAGFSQGGTGALIAGTLYPTKFVNVGGLSPSPQIYDPNNKNYWLKNVTGKDKPYKFNDSSNKHLLMSSGYAKSLSSNGSENEFVYYHAVDRCTRLFGDENGFVTIKYNYERHHIDLFLQEIFNFLYYVQHDELPSLDIVKDVFGDNKAIKTDVKMPSDSHTHSYGNAKVTKEATCTADGEKTLSCSCGATTTEVIKALGHSMDNGKVTKEATATSEGIKTFTCTRCGYTETQTIPKLDNGEVPSIPKNLSSDWCSAKGVNDGRITNVTSAMEYDTNTNFKNAKQCTDYAVTGLAPGQYFVRYRATATTPAGKYTGVIIDVRSADLKQYTVTFDSKGGTTFPSEKVVAGKPATYLGEPTKSGYSFTGWYKDSACTSEYVFSNPVNSDITIYAGWKSTSNASNLPVIDSIKTDFGGTSVKMGQDYTITVNASGSNLKYQWMWSVDAQNWDTSKSTGNKNATIQLEGKRPVVYYKCVVSNESGSVTSDTIAIDLIKPVVTASVSDNSVKKNQQYTISVDTKSTKLNYQWYVKINNENWKESTVPDCKKDTINLTGKHNSVSYKCKVMLGEFSIESEPITITLK